MLYANKCVGVFLFLMLLGCQSSECRKIVDEMADVFHDKIVSVTDDGVVVVECKVLKEVSLLVESSPYCFKGENYVDFFNGYPGGVDTLQSDPKLLNRDVLYQSFQIDMIDLNANNLSVFVVCSDSIIDSLSLEKPKYIPRNRFRFVD